MEIQPARSSAVVFGASGAIGRALTERLAVRGNHVVYGAARDLTAALPADVRRIGFDLADETSIAAAVAQIEEPPALVIVATGLLHDAAGGIAPEKSLRSIDPGAMAAVFAANTIGPALLAKHLLPRLPRDRPAIFAVLSARVGSIGDNRLGGWHSYRAAKAALNQIIRTLSIELATSRPDAICVALHPGTVATGLSAPFRGRVPPARLFTPEVAAAHLLRVIDGVARADSGALLAWDGSLIPP